MGIFISIHSLIPISVLSGNDTGCGSEARILQISQPVILLEKGSGAQSWLAGVLSPLSCPLSFCLALFCLLHKVPQGPGFHRDTFKGQVKGEEWKMLQIPALPSFDLTMLKPQLRNLKLEETESVSEQSYSSR